MRSGPCGRCGDTRPGLVAQASSAIQRMQKVLTEMNIQLSTVLSDLSGVSGMKILHAILAGERDPWKLAALVRPEVKARPADIARSLEGNWREELLFILRQEVELYEVCQQKIADCDRQMRHHLESFGSQVDLSSNPIGPKPRGKKGSKNAPQFRPAHGVVSHHRNRLDADQRHRRADGADGNHGGGRRSEGLSQ
jgi:transposase